MLPIHRGDIKNSSNFLLSCFSCSQRSNTNNKLWFKRQISYDITYTWNLKYGTNELSYETETESWTQGTDGRLPRAGGGAGRGVEWEVGVSRCKLLFIEWINNRFYDTL